MRTSRVLSMIAIGCITALANSVAALNIALTNDDGWDAVGIQVMKTALEAAGHHVTLAAPLTDQSGSSMALDLEPLAVRKEAENQYSVALFRDPSIGAKPGNSALVAIGIVQEAGRSPDLLISGINTSAHIGGVAMLSGTVGAAIHSVTSVLNGPVPAIAVGTDAPNCDKTCQQSHYEVVADFIVRFVAYLETRPGFLSRETGLLPTGVGLLISYPTSDAILGVKVAVQSDGVLLNGQKVSGGFVCAGTGCSGLAVNATQRSRLIFTPDFTAEIHNSDLGYFTEGYATIVPITPNMTAASPLVFRSALAGFAP